MSKRGQGRYFWRKFGDGEVETYEFGVAQPLEYEEEFTARFERFNNPENANAEQGGVSTSVTRAKIQPCILKRGNRKTLKMQILGNVIRKVIFRTQPASGNRCEVWRHT